MDKLCDNCHQLPIFTLVTCSICNRQLCENPECWDTPVRGTNKICGACLSNNKSLEEGIPTPPLSPENITPRDDDMPSGDYLPGELENMTTVELRGEVWGNLNILQRLNPHTYTIQWFKKEYPTILGVAQHPNSCEDKERLRILVLYLAGIAQEEATATNFQGAKS